MGGILRNCDLVYVPKLNGLKTKTHEQDFAAAAAAAACGVDVKVSAE